MRRAAKPLARIAMWLALSAAIPDWPAAAQPVTERILSSASIAEEPDCAHLTIHFNLPVRYLNHFPYETGREVCIRVRPLALGANEAAFRLRRESLRPPDSELAAISRIEYEGDAVNGACITVNFRKPAFFSVAQGSDYRSIAVAIASSPTQASCKARVIGAPLPSSPEGATR
jgi:hypothetical protein